MVGRRQRRMCVVAHWGQCVKFSQKRVISKWSWSDLVVFLQLEVIFGNLSSNRQLTFTNQSKSLTNHKKHLPTTIDHFESDREFYQFRDGFDRTRMGVNNKHVRVSASKACLGVQHTPLKTTHITTQHTTPCFHNHNNALHRPTGITDATQPHTTTQTHTHQPT